MAKEFAVSCVEGCVVIQMRWGENRLNPDFISAMNSALDKAESYEDAKAVVTIGDGKHYCLGLDLDYLSTAPADDALMFSENLQKLLLRILTFPLVTVAAINGHVYAGGVFVAISHDYTIMRTERGWFCLNEVHIKRNFTVAFMKLGKARLPQPQLHAALILGTRYTAEEALAAQIINETSPHDQLLERAIAAGRRLAGKNGLDRATLANLKKDTYRDVCIALSETTRFYSKL
ncbi:uncharacterized protein LOC135351347 [Halichondria panicea]|uniref:uncharacterized protein LOC135351347 n=1 Tax=Halichondria panicea TaxID=6063 RepID=UPI00312B2B47